MKLLAFLSLALAALGPSAAHAGSCPGGKRVVACRGVAGGRLLVEIEQCKKNQGGVLATVYQLDLRSQPFPVGTVPVVQSHSTRPGAPTEWIGRDFDLAVAFTTAPNRDGTHQGRISLGRAFGSVHGVAMSCSSK